MKIYNFLSRKKELFKPIRKDWVGLYTCGPTVYNYAHIGNLRTYIFEDVLRRALEYAGYKVRHVMNITDIDDKIIRDAAAAGKTIFEFVKPYETAFFDDLKKLNITKAWRYPKATDHIPEMIRMISALLNNGYAYQANGSIYFSIKKFKFYGRLGRIKKQEFTAGVRADADEYTKEDVQDFALWKAPRPGEPSWPAPFGEGRPGWHLECSAMSMKYLGETFDIHAGGVDLLFPHHENEIAQSEGTTGMQFVRYFVEGEHLLVNGEKMSKSLGNVYTLRDIESRGIDPIAFRYLTLTAHYRSKLNFTWESLDAAQNSLEHLSTFIQDLLMDTSATISSAALPKKYRARFTTAISNDIDSPKALSVVWNIINHYRKEPSAYNPKAVRKFLYECDEILGLGLKKISSESIPRAVRALAEKRERYRHKKEWGKADEMREKILEHGYVIEDTPEGPKIKKH